MLALGCSAHYMALLGKEISPNNVMKYVVEIQKFFQNHYRHHHKLLQKGSQMPNESKWKSDEAFISTFIIITRCTSKILLLTQ